MRTNKKIKGHKVVLYNCPNPNWTKIKALINHWGGKKARGEIIAIIQRGDNSPYCEYKLSSKVLIKFE